jgi:hypothetical protein
MAGRKRRTWVPPTERGVDYRLLDGGVEKRLKRRPSRLESNEELMLAALEKHGSITLRLLPMIKCSDGLYRSLRGAGIIVKHLRSQGKLLRLVKGIVEFIQKEGARIVK